MDENKKSTDNSLIKKRYVNTGVAHKSGYNKNPINTDQAIPSGNESGTISDKIQKNIADYNDNLFWNIRY